MKRNLIKYLEREHLIVEFLSYDEESGQLIWQKRPPYSRIIVGNRAGNRLRNGRSLVKLNGSLLYVHHIIWWLVYSKWPTDELDHANGDPTDNRISNLREADRFKNTQNSRYRGIAGLKGAYPLAHGDRWFSRITANGKSIYLGIFLTEKKAHFAYCVAAAKYHGEFACTGR